MTTITQGKDFHIFKRVTVTSNVFTDNSDIDFNFRGNPSFSLINEGSDTIEYSFNGLTVHGDLVPNSSTSSIVLNNIGVSRIWFRAATGSPVVRIEAHSLGEISAVGSSSSGGGGGGGGTVDQGSAASVTQAWPVKISDGSNFAGLTTVSGSRALKVDVVQSVGAAGSNFGSAVPATGTAVGFSDGTNLQSPRVFDADSGAGTQYVLGVNLRQIGNGGSTEIGVQANPLRVDPTGSTTQPISGTVTANIGTTNGVALDTTVSSMSAKLPSTLGQTNMAGSLSVVVANNQSAILVDTELPTAASLADATVNPSTTSVGSLSLGFNGTTWDRIRSGINGVVSSVTGWINVLSGGKYNITPPTLTDGQFTVMQLDANGNLKTNDQSLNSAIDTTNGVLAVQIKPLAVSTYAPTTTNDWGSNVTLNIKASIGNVFSIIATNRNASTRYLQLHNTATTPSGGAVPRVSFPVPTNSSLIIGSDFFTTSGFNFSTGIAYGWSTTAGTYTAATASEHDTTIIWR